MGGSPATASPYLIRLIGRNRNGDLPLPGRHCVCPCARRHRAVTILRRSSGENDGFGGRLGVTGRRAWQRRRPWTRQQQRAPALMRRLPPSLPQPHRVRPTPPRDPILSVPVPQVCAGFGVKRTARGRAGRARLSSPGPSVDGRNQNPPCPIWRHFPQTLKKAAKAARNSRSECTPKEIARLDAEAAKKRSRRAVVKVNAAAAKFAAERDAKEAARHKAAYMENVIFEAGHGRAYDPEETQSQDGRAQYVPDEEADDSADYDHGDSWHEDDDIYVEGDGDEEEEEGNDVDISGAPLFIDELTQRAEAQKKRKSIRTAFQSLEAFKARHNDKPFTLTHCWTLINNCPKFKDQYRELQRKRGLKTTKFAGGGDGEALKRPRGKTNSKVDDIRDASSMALHDTLHGMMSQKDVRDEKKRQSKDEQMKQYLDLQRKKLEMEEATKKRKIDMEEAARQRQLDIEADNVKARQRQLDIEATNAATKAKEVALAIMSVDLSKMSDKMRAWFEARQKEMLDAEGLN
ncbi:uncharacterized protein [Aegilops tauschii subsp. strangulata]|uniref:uncharacterized protein n=1 Tax=Aegilops tauschii subsp. strangulata TaxID=200361 RepID=UPI003CC86A53